MPNDCFWQSLRSKVPQFREKHMQPNDVRAFLSRNNRKTSHVRRKTNHSPVKKGYTAKELSEGLQWRKTLIDTATPEHGDPGSTWAGWKSGGHETGADDPWLALCVELLRVRIVQRFSAPEKRTAEGNVSWVKCVVEYSHTHFNPERDPTITIDCNASHAQ